MTIVRMTDCWWLSFEEKLLQKSQLLVGIDNFSWSKFVMLIEGVIIISIRVFHLDPGGTLEYLLNNQYFLWIMTIGLIGGFISVNRKRNRVYKELENGYKSYLKLEWENMRMIYICGCPFAFGLLFINETRFTGILFLLILLELYALCCDPLPPQSSKLKEWFRTMLWNDAKATSIAVNEK